VSAQTDVEDAANIIIISLLGAIIRYAHEYSEEVYNLAPDKFDALFATYAPKKPIYVPLERVQAAKVPHIPLPDAGALIITPLNDLYTRLSAEPMPEPPPYDPERPDREHRYLTVHSPAAREAAHLAEVERRVAAEWTHLRREFLRAEREECGIARPRKTGARWSFGGDA
jgi:hypothetical protein